jgi:hypothetical protein
MDRSTRKPRTTSINTSNNLANGFVSEAQVAENTTGLMKELVGFGPRRSPARMDSDSRTTAALVPSPLRATISWSGAPRISSSRKWLEHSPTVYLGKLSAINPPV